jgi:hypothetical protein
MLAAGDVDEMRVVLDWVSGFIPLALARTAALLPGQAGIFFTEVSDINGLYQSSLCKAEPRRNTLPKTFARPQLSPQNTHLNSQPNRRLHRRPRSPAGV